MGGGGPSTTEVRAPEPLAPDHEFDAFTSGVAPLDDWLKHRARSNEADGASRTFVCCAGQHVVGYYSLAAASLMHSVAIGRVRRNMPDPVPAVLLGRLAIDRNWQGKGLGGDLLRDAILRVVASAKIIGVRALLVHAISEDAKTFYAKHGFRVSPVAAMTPMITIDEAQKLISPPSPSK